MLLRRIANGSAAGAAGAHHLPSLGQPARQASVPRCATVRRARSTPLIAQDVGQAPCAGISCHVSGLRRTCLHAGRRAGGRAVLPLHPLHTPRLSSLTPTDLAGRR